MRGVMWSLPELGLLISEILIGEDLGKLELGKKLWRGNPRQTWRANIGKFAADSQRDSGKRNTEKGRWGRGWETRGAVQIMGKTWGIGSFVSVLLELWEDVLLTAASTPTQVRFRRSKVTTQHDMLQYTLGRYTHSHGTDRAQVGTGSKGYSEASRTAVGPLRWGSGEHCNPLGWLPGPGEEDNWRTWNWPWGVHSTHMRQAEARSAGKLSDPDHIEGGQIMFHQGQLELQVTRKTKDVIWGRQRETTQAWDTVSFLYRSKHHFRELKGEERNHKKGFLCKGTELFRECAIYGVRLRSLNGKEESPGRSAHLEWPF